MQNQRAQPDGVDGSAMEMKLATTTRSDDAELLVDTDNSWMSSLPEISMIDVSPQASNVQLTFGPHAGKKAQSVLEAMEDDDDDQPPPPDFNENDVPPTSKE